MKNYLFFVQKFHKDLEKEEKLLQASLLFLEKVSGEENKNKFDYISFNLLADITQENNQQQLLKLVNYLCDDRVNILVLRFHYFPLSHNRQDPIDIDTKDVNEALRNDKFYDPETGEEDLYFKKYLKMYFSLSDNARELHVS